MEVKDITKVGVQEVLSLTPQGNAQSEQHDSADTHSVSTEAPPKDVVSISELSRREGQHEVVNKLNETISTLNVAVAGTAKIGNVFDSIEGLVEQAGGASADAQRHLEVEANQLVDAISTIANSKSENGQKPLAGDTIELQIERSIGKTLTILLPDGAKNSFGLTDISFSPAENILATRNAVARAKAQFEALQGHVYQAVDAVKNTVNTVDVSLQNAEASRVTVRSLQNAIELSTSTSSEISANPEVAIDSIGAAQGAELVR